MKTLQNNFTTVEQSKRLLELGVPVDSADCYFFKDGKKYNGVPRPFFLFPRKYKYVEDFNAAYGDKIYPCWSVGRLIEIFVKARTWDTKGFRFDSNELVDRQVEYLVALFNENSDRLDFSKLEE